MNPNTLIRKATLAISLMIICGGVLHSSEYWGSRRSDKYHLPSCQWAQRISPSNKRVFASVNEAQASGYVGCKVCRPPSADGSATGKPSRSPSSESSLKTATATQMTTGRCLATTKKGTQCKRSARSGSEYCWQHGG